MTSPEFTTEQLYQQAQGNQTGFILATIAYFKEQGQTPQEWVTFVGKQFAPFWDEVKDQGARAAMQAVVVNFVSAGGTVQSLSGDETQAEASVANWPPADLMQHLGLTLEDIDPFYEIFTPVAAFLNLRYAWRRQGNQITFELSQVSP